MNDLDFAAMLVSRVCHDLVSPVGAVVNGLEVLEDERDAGRAHHVCGGQIGGSVPLEATAENTAIAYEPVWAIGSGKTPSDDDIVAMHAHIRRSAIAHLGPMGKGMRILYGGSVKPSNAKSILSLDDVNGALVGGASLKAQDFLAIIAGARIR